MGKLNLELISKTYYEMGADKIIATLWAWLLFGGLALGEGWLGVAVSSPADLDRKGTHVEPETGFLIAELISDGPLAKAGLQNGDLWWKLDGQILVNKAQLRVLLKNKKVGQVVSVEFFREGRLSHSRAVVGERKRRKLPKNDDLVAGKSGGKQQFASLEDGDDRFRLSRVGSKWRFTVISKDGMVFTTLIGADDLNQRVPVGWHDSFLILKMALEHEPEKEVERSHSEKNKGKVGRLDAVSD